MIQETEMQRGFG